MHYMVAEFKNNNHFGVEIVEILLMGTQCIKLSWPMVGEGGGLYRAGGRDPNLHCAIPPRDESGHGHNKSAPPPLWLCPLAKLSQ